MELKSNASSVEESIEKVAIALSNSTPALEQIAAMMRSRFAKSLEQGISPEGVPHPPLKSPRRSNRRGGTIPATLYSTVRGNTVEVGYDHPRAIAYHEGSKIPARIIVPKKRQALFWAGARHPVKRVNIPTVVIPPRPLVGYSEADVVKMEEMISDYWEIEE